MTTNDDRYRYLSISPAMMMIVQQANNDECDDDDDDTPCYAMYAISASSQLLPPKQRQPTEHVLEQWHLVLQEQLDDHRVTYHYDGDDDSNDGDDDNG